MRQRFGESLEAATLVDGIPEVLHALWAEILAGGGLEREGIFRLSADESELVHGVDRTEMELALESDLMRDAGYELVGVEKNPFASPVPEQSPAMANDAQRANEWLAVYVPARSSGAPREPEARADGRKREGDGGNAAAKRRK